MFKMEINTERLNLKIPGMKYLEDMFELCENEATSRYSDWLPHADRAETKRYLRFLKRNSNIKKTLTYGVILKEEDKLIGTCSITYIVEKKIAQIGYSFNGKYHGKGYATEAVKALIGAFEYQRVEAKVMPENTPSVKLLQRLGFKNEGLLKLGAACKNRLVDIYIFSLLK